MNQSTFLQQGSYMTVNGDVYAKLLLIDFIGSGSNPLIRRQALTEVGGFDESMTPSEDRDMWLRLAKHAIILSLCDPTSVIQTIANSQSTNVLRMEKSSLRVIEQAFTQAPRILHI
jgi:GT2 family glycosyltransferase